MSTVALVGIDLAKNVFQLHGVDQKGKQVFKKKLTRHKLIEFVANLSPCTLAMEACGGANFFARKFESFGHEIKLIAPQFVKPFVKGNKNDAADARAICEAAQRPDMNFVSPKSMWQQDLQFVHRVRERLVKNRTALMNEMRGMLSEYGIIISKGRASLGKVLQDCLASQDNSELSLNGKKLLQALYSELLEIEEKIAARDQELKKVSQESEKTQKLEKVGGFGVITVTALLIALANPSQFKNGRQFSSWIGLVPRHSGTGGKNRILGISKRGDSYLRTLLIHGARAKLQGVIRKAGGKNKLDPLENWVYQLYLRNGWNKTSVALANKNARIAWALMMSNEAFDANKAAEIKKIVA
jgi:transposase